MGLFLVWRSSSICCPSLPLRVDPGSGHFLLQLDSISKTMLSVYDYNYWPLHKLPGERCKLCNSDLWDCLGLTVALGLISTVSRVQSLILPGGWVRAHFPEQRLVIEPIVAQDSHQPIIIILSTKALPEIMAKASIYSLSLLSCKLSETKFHVVTSLSISIRHSRNKTKNYYYSHKHKLQR